MDEGDEDDEAVVGLEDIVEVEDFSLFAFEDIDRIIAEPMKMYGCVCLCENMLFNFSLLLLFSMSLLFLFLLS
jgi:hypothetical protein